MAAIEIAPSFGGELKDGFKPVNAWVSDSHTRWPNRCMHTIFRRHYQELT